MRSRIRAAGMPLLFIVTVFAVGWGSSQYIGHELAARQNTVELHTAVALSASAGAAGRSLTVNAIAPITNNCNRIISHLMYRCDGPQHLRADGSHSCDGQPVYYPLTASISGPGFGLAARQVAQGKPYTAVLALAAGMPPGEYQYVQRALYICSWMGGLIERRIPYETKPLSVHLD